MNMISRYTLSFALIFSTFGILLSAQTPLDEAVRRADVAPAWPGCDPKMTDCTKTRMGEFIKANLQIPPDAKAQGAGGVVMMEFVIEKNGTIGEIRPLHDPGLGLGAEATRVIELLNTKKIKWIPAEQEGKRIAFRYTVPVSFNMDQPAKEKTTTAPAKVNTNVIYDIVDVMPRYAGCEAAATDSINCTFSKVLTHFKTNLKYPEDAVKNRTQGQVVTEFIIDEKGMMTNPVVTQGIGHGCDEEALRVLALMPAWSPGLMEGEPVKVRMKLPVLFQFPKE